METVGVSYLGVEVRREVLWSEWESFGRASGPMEILSVLVAFAERAGEREKGESKATSIRRNERKKRKNKSNYLSKSDSHIYTRLHIHIVKGDATTRST